MTFALCMKEILPPPDWKVKILPCARQREALQSHQSGKEEEEAPPIRPNSANFAADGAA